MSYDSPAIDDFEPTGDLALDLANTVVPSRHGPIDLLRTPDDVATWLVAVGIDAGGTMRPPTERRILLDEALRLRGAVDRLLRGIAASQPVDEAAVFALDRVLASARATTHVFVVYGAVASEAVDEALMPAGVLAPAARAALRLVAEADPGRLRSCAADDCTRWFLDTSRSGRRRWCSMTSCGNRAKAARFRRRHG
jgi:predicted RNA-binding Zn ribbon-like protein